MFHFSMNFSPIKGLIMSFMYRGALLEMTCDSAHTSATLLKQVVIFSTRQEKYIQYQKKDIHTKLVTVPTEPNVSTPYVWPGITERWILAISCLGRLPEEWSWQGSNERRLH